MTYPKLAASLLLIGLCGCGNDDDGAATPPPPPPPEVAARLTGTYAVTSTFDVPLNALLPGQAADTFATVHEFRKNPANTLFDLLEEAGVPRASQLHEALPGVLQDRLDGWINDFILHALYQNRAVATELELIDTVGSRLLLRFDVLTDLELDSADATGASTGKHTLRGVRFGGLPEMLTLEIPTLPPAIAGGITESRLPIRLAVARAAGSDARVTAGDHAFGLPIGQYALAALDLALEARYGHDLRGTLGLMVDCPAMAAHVAGKCVGPVCVGHQSDLQAVCEAGLDEVAAKVKDRLLAHDFKAIHFVSGAADHRSPDHLDAGVWKANVDVGQGERAVSATFSGLRH